MSSKETKTEDAENILLAFFLCFLILSADFWAETIASFLSSLF